MLLIAIYVGFMGRLVRVRALWFLFVIASLSIVIVMLTMLDYGVQLHLAWSDVEWCAKLLVHVVLFRH